MTNQYGVFVGFLVLLGVVLLLMRVNATVRA